MSDELRIAELEALINEQPWPREFVLACEAQKMTPSEFLREHFAKVWRDGAGAEQ
jgi:hypothetical protein